MTTHFVLVVDDEDTARRSLRRFFEATGDVVVTTANSVEGARAALRNARFDGVVADLALDAESRGGLTVLDLVRSQDDAEGGGPTELLLVTGGKDIPAANRAEELGARFLHRPFDTSALVRFLDRVRARAALGETVIEEASRLSDMAKLPARIRQAFVLVVTRRSVEEICLVMGISENTFRTYLKVLIRALRRTAGIEAKDRKDIALAVLSRVLRARDSTLIG